MVAISFNGETSRGPFYELILRDEKRQTIREPRIRPIRSGSLATLYWKQRTPKHLKPIHFIAETHVTSVRRVSLWDLWNDEENAIADGFGSLDEFRDWFGGEHWREYDEDEQREATEGIPLDIITWGPLFVKGKAIK